MATLLPAEASTRPYDSVKRGLDLAVCSVLLVVLLPLALLIAIAVRLDTKGPVLLRQRRVGRGGRVFECLKFRTMYAGADDVAHRAYMAALISGRALGVVDARSGQVVYRVVADERVTRVGRLLRGMSLDELPQLWNVLEGHMALVGPRPPLDWEVELYRPEHLDRLAVRPGITGLWQTTAWDRATFDEMVELDRRYIRDRSFLLDVRILLGTIAVVPRRWAAR
jgi:lipopolysaccharide/colanic/teichoic acid biosynthesis glycosyltransferase